MRTVRARNKERGAINKSLEERAAQRDTEVARLVEQMSSLKMQLASKENESSSLQAQLLEARGHVAQLSKELEASKATFEFVHQQLEESRSRHTGSYMASTVPPSTSMRGALDSMSRSDLASMQARNPALLKPRVSNVFVVHANQRSSASCPGRTVYIHFSCYFWGSTSKCCKFPNSFPSGKNTGSPVARNPIISVDMFITFFRRHSRLLQT